MPGPTLGTQSATDGVVVCVEAFAANGSNAISAAKIAPVVQRLRLCGPRLRLCGVDPELGHGLRDICGTVLLTEGERM